MHAGVLSVVQDIACCWQVCEEKAVFEAVMQWLGAQPHDSNEAEQLMPLVRFPLMSSHDLQAGTSTLD